jgi:hypothetical protein
MPVQKYTVLFVMWLCLIPAGLFSQSSQKKHGNGNRLYFGPVIGLYTINKHHAVQPSQKMSGLLGFKREQRLGNDYRTFLLVGAEYFLHGLNFRSYYFSQDTLQLYDKSFGYNYSLVIHELGLPLQVKYLFRRADNSLFSPYLVAGYQLRYLLPGRVSVSQNGEKIKEGIADMKFKNTFMTERMNAFVNLGIGWQRNGRRSSGGSFFAELNCRYGFSSYYFETAYAARSLYISGIHISLQLGLKF